jgi:hypothetical protein
MLSRMPVVLPPPGLHNIRSHRGRAIPWLQARLLDTARLQLMFAIHVELINVVNSINDVNVTPK